MIFLAKALESLAGAESEYANGRYNNCANRCYYACFQAAMAACMQAGARPRGERGQWGHDFVQAEFARQLIHQRKLYDATLRDVLDRLIVLRRTADYTPDQVSETRAFRALRRARAFVAAIQKEGEPR